MYEELCIVWRKEQENLNLERLPPNFYLRICEYLKNLQSESRMIDKKSIKAALLTVERQNVLKMLKELIRTRFKKIVKTLAKNNKFPVESLTEIEKKYYIQFSNIGDGYERLLENILNGELDSNIEEEQKSLTVRFLKDIPSVVGTDMNLYGPFKVGDIASLPSENIKLLVKQNLAELIKVD